MFRCIWGERARKKEKWWRDLDVGTRREREQVLDGRRRKNVQERGEILSKDGRKIGWMKKEGKDREEEGWKIERKILV
jgi:hypothetical protein